LEEDFEVDARELLCPADLPASGYFSSCKVLEVLMIREHLYLMDSAFAVTTPVFETIDDCEECLVMDLVVDFCGCELP
jgi:hypothetical protein